MPFFFFFTWRLKLLAILDSLCSSADSGFRCVTELPLLSFQAHVSRSTQ